MEEIIIIGIGFVPASEQGSHMLTRNEMTEELAKSAVGLPVFIEHDLTMPIGQVKSAYIDQETKNLLVELRIFHNPDIICHLSEALSIRRFSGLIVLGQPDLLGIFQEYYSMLERSIFTEFSVVEIPDSPGCLIIDWKFSSYMHF